MTVREAAIRLSVSESTVYALVRNGLLRCVRNGLGRGTVRISAEQLQQYLEGAAVPPPPKSPPSLRL